jgi:hypothetical protein
MQSARKVNAMKQWRHVPSLALMASSVAVADTPAPPTSPPASAGTTIYQTTSGAGSSDWSSYETDSAPGSISAAGMLGISGGAITNVESIKDVSVAVNSLMAGGSKAGVALSITPARSGILPMDQRTYVGSGDLRRIGTLFARLYASTTLGYAENDTTISSASYHQQAASIQTTGFLNSNDDPVVGLYKALSQPISGCDKILVQSSTPPVATKGTPAEGSTDAPMASAATQATEEANWKACKAKIAKQVPWNPGSYSLGYATGWIKSTAGDGAQGTLGRTYFIGGQYGFLNPRHADGSLDPTSTRGMLLAVAYRRSESEPVLTTLGTSKVNYKSSSIVYAKLAGGSSTLRGLFEYNNTRSENITQSQLALKIAVGVDAQLAKNTWISFRFGKQNTITGTQTQNASLFNISYSPAALLSK